MDEPHNHDIGDDPSNQDNKPEDHSLNIIIYPYTDPVHDSPALNFPVIRKNMVDGKLLKFGRKVNKEVINDDYFITFQSKVVSRNHAEIWYKEGQLYFRDIGSSSGTFLNKLRLSPSGKESRPYLLRSGDVIQLGIDYHGKKEDVYKCIMMKIIIQGKEADIRRKNNIERLNNAIKELISAASPNSKNTDQMSSVECCICLNTLAPYQALFLAPCTHCFHYKCVHPLLGGGIMFLCPLCRQVANLEATVSTDNLFEMGDDLVLKSKNSLYHMNKICSNNKLNSSTENNNNSNNNNNNNNNNNDNDNSNNNKNKNTDTDDNRNDNNNKMKKSLTNLNKKDKNKRSTQPFPSLKIQEQKSNENINNSNEKNKNQDPSLLNVPDSTKTTGTSSNNYKKKDKESVSPTSGKKLSRKETLKSLITTTFLRKRSSSTQVPNLNQNFLTNKNSSKYKNTKSTGNIVIQAESKRNGHSEDKMIPINVLDTTTGKPVENLQEERLRVEEENGNASPIVDDDTTTPNVATSPGKQKNINSDELFMDAMRDRLTQ
jgi:hypothetical protein